MRKKMKPPAPCPVCKALAPAPTPGSPCHECVSLGWLPNGDGRYVRKLGSPAEVVRQETAQ